MTDFYNSLVHRMSCALEITNFYWLHTDADEFSRVRVENLVRSVSQMTGKPIEKYVMSEESTLERSKCVRYEDGSLIIVTSEADERWVRYSVVKELCHIYCDNQDEMQPDSSKAISSILPKYAKNLDDFVAIQPNQQAEQLAELMAIELLYPIDFRDKDIARLGQGMSHTEISHERGVPEKFVEAYLQPELNEAVRNILSVASSIRKARQE